MHTAHLHISQQTFVTLAERLEPMLCRMAIEGDGLWWFKTEMPGETLPGWGADPAPHIHYDIRCSGCKASDAFPGTRYQYWSKF